MSDWAENNGILQHWLTTITEALLDFNVLHSAVLVFAQTFATRPTHFFYEFLSDLAIICNNEERLVTLLCNIVHTWNQSKNAKFLSKHFLDANYLLTMLVLEDQPNIWAFF